MLPIPILVLLPTPALGLPGPPLGWKVLGLGVTGAPVAATVLLPALEAMGKGALAAEEKEEMMPVEATTVTRAGSEVVVVVGLSVLGGGVEEVAFWVAEEEAMKMVLVICSGILEMMVEVEEA